MKGILLCGGSGTRLLPLTRVTNKHLLPVGNKPMVFYPLEKMKEAGINDILVITGTEHLGDIVSLLGSGSDYGVSFTYKVQDKPLGIAHAVSLGNRFIGNDDFVVILGDNIFEFDMKKLIDKFKSVGRSLIVLRKSKNPNRFGVARIVNNELEEIVEKPGEDISDFIVTGVYFYKPEIFKYFPRLTLSARGEYEISDLHNYLIKDKKLDYSIEESFWSDAGTLETYFEVNRKYGKL
ncbi:spore coat protein [candidate division TA06 bacterium]|uniref:glucose-1-phosphate thymidylyltransferase n=1 Tax=candidate division TA06 bacterium TaxID=2250710 RepID=A0A660SBB2_UNCT6|nr:MAG: spore coat protein [candidate division TA06 bacterium]